LGSLILSDNDNGCKGVENLLGQVKSIIKCHKENSNKQGEDFNIFSILKMERREVETHSRFIYELLNPNGRHGQESIFLKEFARIVLKSNSFESARDPKREDVTENLDKDRRIDFTLETDDEVFGIELKIDAADQSNQLSDYLKTLQHRAKADGRKATVFYLTLDGKDASENSHKDCSYERVSFSEELLEWIIACIQLSAEKSVLREALIQYKILIEKLTGKNKVLSSMVAEKIRSSVADFEAALCVEKSIDNAKISVQKDLWDKLKYRLDKKSTLNFKEYTSTSDSNECKGKSLDKNIEKYYSKKNKWFGLMCDLGSLSGCPDVRIALYIEIWNRVYFGLCSIDSDGKKNDNCNGDCFCGIRESIGNPKVRRGDEKNDKKRDKKWLSKLCYLSYEDQDIKFNPFNEVAAKLVDKDVLKEVVDDLVTEIDTLYNKIKTEGFVK